jgi:hypothetical protein
VRRLVVALGVFVFVIAVSTSAAAPAPRMPAPQRLTRVIAFVDLNGIRLSPPPTNVHPSVGPAEAWKVAVPGTWHASTYRLVLAQWTSAIPPGPSAPTQALVWLVFGTHVAVPNTGPIGSKGPAVFYETVMQPVDAATGLRFATVAFPPKEVAGMGKDLRPYVG